MVNGTILSFQNMYYNVHVNFLQSLTQLLIFALEERGIIDGALVTRMNRR